MPAPTIALLLTWLFSYVVNGPSPLKIIVHPSVYCSQGNLSCMMYDDLQQYAASVDKSKYDSFSVVFPATKESPRQHSQRISISTLQDSPSSPTRCGYLALGSAFALSAWMRRHVFPS